MSATDRFVDELGLIAQESGDSRISGRMVGLLLVEGRELSLGQISEKLGISRASVSTNARTLARRGAIRRAPHLGDRQDYYQLSELSYLDFVGDLAERFRRHAKTIDGCVKDMRTEANEAAERALEMQRFFEKSAEIMDDWAATLRSDEAKRKDEK